MRNIGDPAPWFVARSTVNPKLHFDTVAGHYVVLSFFGSASQTAAAQLLRDLHEARNYFDVVHVAFFGVSADVVNAERITAAPISAGVVYFAGFDATIARGYGLIDPSNGGLHPTTFVLDE